MGKSYWRDLGSRIWSKVKPTKTKAKVTAVITALTAQVILSAKWIGDILYPYFFRSGFEYLLGAIIGVILCFLEFWLWVDFLDWKNLNKGIVSKN